MLKQVRVDFEWMHSYDGQNMYGIAIGSVPSINGLQGETYDVANEKCRSLSSLVGILQEQRD